MKSNIARALCAPTASRNRLCQQGLPKVLMTRWAEEESSVPWDSWTTAAEPSSARVPRGSLLGIQPESPKCLKAFQNERRPLLRCLLTTSWYLIRDRRDFLLLTSSTNTQWSWRTTKTAQHRNQIFPQQGPNPFLITSLRICTHQAAKKCKNPTVLPNARSEIGSHRQSLLVLSTAKI